MSVKVEVIEKAGACGSGHEIGECWSIERWTPEGICLSAFCSLLPWIHLSRQGKKPPWTIDIACPDPENRVVFRLTRVNSRHH